MGKKEIAGGAKPLRYLLARFHGNTRPALAVYNAGGGKVDRYRRGPPFKEAQQYVRKVRAYQRVYRSTASGVSLHGDLLPQS